jgi:hypothetical protein
LDLGTQNLKRTDPIVFRKHDGTHYTIANAFSGRALDVAEFRMDNGTNIQMWDNYESDNQKWAFYL